MPLKLDVLRELSEVASVAAHEAGALIQGYSEGEFTVQHKEGCESLATQVVTEVDEQSQAIILKHLNSTLDRYDLALLTEEQEDDESRFRQDYFWCIDPLDGTLPFTQRQSGYAVSIALVARGGQPIIGVVYDPIDRILWNAIDGVGVLRNQVPWQPDASVNTKGPLRFYCDCSFDTHPQRAAMLARMKSVAEQVNAIDWTIEVGGGAVMNALRVLQSSEQACYFKAPKMTAGGGSIWDFAATAAVYAAAGRSVTNFKGGRLDLNRAGSTFMNHEGVMYATNGELANAVRAHFDIL